MTFKFKCIICDPPNCDEVSICEDAIKCWKSSTRSIEGVLSVSRGCKKNPLQILHCGSYTNNDTGAQYDIHCCTGDYCNNGTFPVLTPVYKSDMSASAAPMVAAVLGLCAAILAMVFLKPYFKKRFGSRPSLDLEAYSGGVLLPHIKFRGDGNQSSGSGSGPTLLGPLTIGKQISLKQLIGKGKYGEVWTGNYLGDLVAVKKFLSQDTESWSNERDIYSKLKRQHRNILICIGSDVISVDGCTENWLVVQYHPRGSLYEYLNSNEIDYAELIKLCSSIVNGIAYLHMRETTYESSKPVIAHRDIKSKNVLVKEDGECVIADFGLALKYTPQTEERIVVSKVRVGTKRYMAPEVLDETINRESIEAFKSADIYALGLVFWEICRRCKTNGIAEEYQPPFFDVVGPVGIDPSFEQMQQIVCAEEGGRPKLPERWSSDLSMKPMVTMIQNCWWQNSKMRWTICRIRKEFLTKIPRNTDGVIIV